MLMIIGTRGWEHKQWNGSFYEDLLPEDWHLKFYSSNFNAALAPASFWTKCSREELAEFCDDIPDEYPLIFETPSNQDSNLYATAKALIPNWVKFQGDAWSKSEGSYTISQAEIVAGKGLKENSAVFKISSSQIISDEEIKQAMLSIKTEFKEKYDVTYVFFDDALVESDVVNTAVTLLKMLVLDH